MKYRVIEKSDGTFWPQKRTCWLWSTLTFTSGIGPSMVMCYDVTNNLSDAWAKLRAYDNRFHRKKADVVKIHEQGTTHETL